MIVNEYDESTKYISSIPRFTKKTELSNTLEFLKLLDDPQLSYKSVHIAGTNGKGSVAKMMALMLEKAGYKTGLFISPHLVKINERMSVNGQDISDADFVRIYNKLKDTVDNEDKLSHPAYFEFLFLMACMYFKEQECDYVVFETGLGGRLDATNVLKPEVSIITSIGMDHMQYLGNTITDIAGEKAGIIKPGIPVVYNTGSSEADKVIIDKCAEIGSICVSVSDMDEALFALHIDKVKAAGLEKMIADFSKKIMTPYQRDNAGTAVIAYLMITFGVTGTLPIDVIRKALDDFVWPARMQFIDEDTVLDGAHNEDAATRLCEAVKVIRNNRGYDRVFLVFAAVDDKDHEKVVKLLCDGMDPDKIYVTEISSGRKTDANKIAGLFLSDLPPDKKDIVVVNNHSASVYYEAKRDIDKIVNETGDKILLVICGSLYLAGEILSIPEVKSIGV